MQQLREENMSWQEVWNKSKERIAALEQTKAELEQQVVDDEDEISKLETEKEDVLSQLREAQITRMQLETTQSQIQEAVGSLETFTVSETEHLELQLQVVLCINMIADAVCASTVGVQRLG